MSNFNSQSPHRYRGSDSRGASDDEGLYDGCGHLGYYDPRGNDQMAALRCWRKIKCSGDRPGARSGAASVIVDDKMYLFGGYGAMGQGLRLFSVLADDHPPIVALTPFGVNTTSPSTTCTYPNVRRVRAVGRLLLLRF